MTDKLRYSDEELEEFRQLAVYRELMANGDGSCGRKIYEYIKSQD